ncbi:hypothetical protein O181_111986 [Austropuccinia psidii MF-1]|uniref:Uncharacterized protein n=1 Tax=Austropuccinia psidii MF-1 TaxID=1389203 RepID=A0A9Q3PT57_9BASI|nr:hypothetical protein [Austropuccinia psidii MF-1]
MEGVPPCIQEEMGTRRSNSFSVVVGPFPGNSRTTLKGRGKDGKKEENSVKEEESDGTEAVPAPVGHFKQMTQILANIREASRPPAFKTSFMKAPDCFDGTQPSKGRRFMHCCQLIFHNDQANFSKGKKKFLYETSFLICRVEK